VLNGNTFQLVIHAKRGVNELTRYSQMREIAGDILRGFGGLLEKFSVPAGARPYSLKWLRYYPDFCEKYHLPEQSSKSLPDFLQKLRDKHQGEYQLKQAGHAVSLYPDLPKEAPRTRGEAKSPAEKTPAELRASPQTATPATSPSTEEIAGKAAAGSVSIDGRSLVSDYYHDLYPLRPEPHGEGGEEPARLLTRQLPLCALSLSTLERAARINRSFL